ncbi:hypothetical protein BKA80DRAFT_275322 [Phyllosticta citrichinensis]
MHITNPTPPAIRWPSRPAPSRAVKPSLHSLACQKQGVKSKARPRGLRWLQAALEPITIPRLLR